METAVVSSLHVRSAIEDRPTESVVQHDGNSAGLHWGAVIAGAFVSAALALILLALGTGLGFSAVSPWSNLGASASTLSKGAIIWLILMEIMASSMGGYLAGRLRTKWVRVHSDEVYFRDTAHGFLAWCVSLVITVAFLTTAATAMVGARARDEGSQGSSGSATSSAPGNYFTDMLLRSNPTNEVPNLNSSSIPVPSTPGTTSDASVRAEVGLIFANALRQGDIPAADKTYLAQVISTRTGLTQPDAERRVSDVFAAEQQAAETARKKIAYSLLWIFVALLIGAFCASFAGTVGGAQRDHVVIV